MASAGTENTDRLRRQVDMAFQQNLIVTQGNRREAKSHTGKGKSKARQPVTDSSMEPTEGKQNSSIVTKARSTSFVEDPRKL